MIFVTVGTHHEPFTRLIRRIDEIAPKIKEEIIVQTGFTSYVPKNVKYFNFKDNLDEYYKKARIIIVQAATSAIEISLKYKKPIIVIPRQKRYGEHINDHQVEFAEFFSKKTGVITIDKISEITPNLLKTYKRKAEIDKTNLLKLQDYLKSLMENGRK